MSCDGDGQTNDFKKDILNLAAECTAVIEQEAELLCANWVVELQQRHENFDLDELEKEAIQQTTERALIIFSNQVRHGNSTPPPSDVPSAKEKIITVIESSEEEEDLEVTAPTFDIAQPGTSSAPQAIIEPVKPTKKKKNKTPIPADRRPSDPCKYCPLNCSIKITERDREDICRRYWKIPVRKRSKAFTQAFTKEIGVVVKHRPNGCAATRIRTCFLYNNAEKIQICHLMLATTLGYHKQSRVPSLAIVDCEECKSLKTPITQ